MAEIIQTPDYTYIPPTPERVEQAQLLYETAQDLSLLLPEVSKPGCELDHHTTVCCGGDHFDFLQMVSGYEVVRFRIERANGFFQLTAESSLLRDAWSVPENVSDGLIAAYGLTLSIGTQAKDYLDIPSGEPISGKHITAKTLANLTLNARLLLPALTTSSRRGDTSFETTMLWNLGADAPLKAYNNDTVVAEFSHEQGGILVENLGRNYLYEEWWSATLLDISSPGEDYNQRIKDALLQLP